MITVERQLVTRLVEVDLADGRQMVVEGIDIVASCGCVFIFGKRLDNMETTLTLNVCGAHLDTGSELLAEIMADTDYDDTDDLIRDLLNR